MKFEFNLNRSAKAAALFVALASSVYAYNDHDGFYFTHLMAGFIAVITALLLVAYWSDALLRILSGCVFIASLNNLYDELFGNPYKFEINEKIFAVVLTFFTSFNLYTLYKQIKDGQPANE